MPEVPAKQSAKSSATTRFAGRVAVVTGASDRGIGGAIAERLAEEGASVALLSREEPARLLKRLERMECPLLWRQCDITQSDQICNSVDACVGSFGRVDVLVNNAGIEIARPFDQLTDDEWQTTIDVNLTGASKVTRAALPSIPDAGGVIVNISSVLGLAGCPSFSAYSAAKAGMIGWTQSLAWELAPRSIRVVCIAPGMIHTPMTHRHVAHLTDEAKQQIQATHPLGVAMPHDVASAVAFLASDEARYITGITLPLGWAANYLLPVNHFMGS